MYVEALLLTKTASHQIKIFLEKNIQYSYNAPTIYQKLQGRIPLNTIRSELTRLYENGKIRKVGRGFYQAKVNKENIDLLENPPTLLHAITVICESPKLQKLRQGLTSHNYNWMNFLEWLEKENFKANKYSRGDKIQYSKVVWFENHDVNITIHNNSIIDIYIGCSKNPIDYHMFRDIYKSIEGYLYCITPFVNERVSQIGINKDFSTFDLDGVNCIKLKDFANAWWQIYRKESLQCVRFECHLNTTKPTLALKDAYQILESFSRPIGNGHGADTLVDVT